MSSSPGIVGIGGNIRDGFSSQRLVRCVFSEAGVLGADARLFGGEALEKLQRLQQVPSVKMPSGGGLIVKSGEPINPKHARCCLP